MSRYDLFRKRIAPIAFFLAIALIAKDSCDKGQRTHTTVELQFAAPARVRAVEVEVFLGDVQFATFHRNAPPGEPIGPCRFELALPRDDGELRIDVDLGATHQRLIRRFQAIEGSKMTVAIPDEN